MTMGDGRWEKDDGQWAVGDGGWVMGKGRRGIDDRSWTMGGGQRGVFDRCCALVGRGCLLATMDGNGRFVASWSLG